MAGQGAGPSRRSHTKSRKGCKTCKRRHIRCDETFPQCRNCTKHQVQCDYVENMASETESQASPQQPTICFTPGTENSIDQWQQTGIFPYPDLQVFPPPQTQELSGLDLRLIHHLSSTSNDLMIKGTSNLTLWTQKIPKFLSIASSYPYVMHALLSFSANHLAFTQSSTELRNLQIHHGTVALRGLHEAIGSFSHSNADAVLAASLLLLWQANDWRSWSSLRAGIRSVLTAMQSWKQDSIFAQYINEENLQDDAFRGHRRSSSLDLRERNVTLQNIVQALDSLRTALAGHQAEYYWIDQIHAYVLRLQSSNPAQTPEDQFGHLYALRKWLFWMPVSLLQKQGGQGPAMLVLSHFYAVALALEPLFPDLGPSFCARIALSPLELILGMTDEMQSKTGLNHTTSMEIASLMQFPRQAALVYRSRSAPSPSIQNQSGSSILGLDAELPTYSSIGNLSPAFAPTLLHYGTGSSSSSFLEVPVSQAGFTYGTQSWGAVPSPQFPPQQYLPHEDQAFGYGDAPLLENFHRGFVPPTPIWT